MTEMQYGDLARITLPFYNNLLVRIIGIRGCCVPHPHEDRDIYEYEVKPIDYDNHPCFYISEMSLKKEL